MVSSTSLQAHWCSVSDASAARLLHNCLLLWLSLSASDDATVLVPASVQLPTITLLCWPAPPLDCCPALVPADYSLSLEQIVSVLTKVERSSPVRLSPIIVCSLIFLTWNVKFLFKFIFWLQQQLCMLVSLHSTYHKEAHALFKSSYFPSSGFKEINKAVNFPSCISFLTQFPFMGLPF